MVVETETLSHKSAYTAEMLMQVIGSRFSTASRLCTDCKSARKVVVEGRKKSKRVQGVSIYRRKIPDTRIEWVESHPEKRWPGRSWWTVDDEGIDRADAVAGQDWARFRIANTDHSGLHIKDTEALLAMTLLLDHPFISNIFFLFNLF